jgi:hypothetical protein
MGAFSRKKTPEMPERLYRDRWDASLNRSCRRSCSDVAPVPSFDDGYVGPIPEEAHFNSEAI